MRTSLWPKGKYVGPDPIKDWLPFDLIAGLVTAAVVGPLRGPTGLHTHLWRNFALMN